MRKVIVIVGPTAVGKTKISIELAKRYNLEILSGDSVAVYKHLDIGSAKPSMEEREGITHHFIDICEPCEQYSVFDFQRSAREYIDSHDVTLICGGTGLYIQSVLFEYEFAAKKRDLSFSDKYALLSNEELYKLLLSLDGGIDQTKLHPNNRNRVLRAIEVIQSTNQRFSSYCNKDKPLYDYYIVYLNVKERKILYDRINQRVDQMFEDGLLDEVTRLYECGITPNAIGYKEFLPYFSKEVSLEEVKETIKKNTRHLAKRQITWFKNQLQTNFYDVNLQNIAETIEIIQNDLDSFLKLEGGDHK